MKVLLDTCTFLWIAAEPDRLSAHARDLYSNRGNSVFLSAVSAWEISLKHGLGRLPLPAPPERYVLDLQRRHGVEELPLDERAALGSWRLPVLHRDPFDRMLIAQAIDGGYVLLTPDPEIARYPARVEW